MRRLGKSCRPRPALPPLKDLIKVLPPGREAAQCMRGSFAHRACAGRGHSHVASVRASTPSQLAPPPLTLPHNPDSSPSSSTRRRPRAPRSTAAVPPSARTQSPTAAREPGDPSTHPSRRLDRRTRTAGVRDNGFKFVRPRRCARRRPSDSRARTQPAPHTPPRRRTDQVGRTGRPCSGPALRPVMPAGPTHWGPAPPSGRGPIERGPAHGGPRSDAAGRGALHAGRQAAAKAAPEGGLGAGPARTAPGGGGGPLDAAPAHDKVLPMLSGGWWRWAT